MHMRQIKIFCILYLFLRNIYPFRRKSFFTKFRVHLALWQPKVGLTVKMVFFSESLGTFRVKAEVNLNAVFFAAENGFNSNVSYTF